MADKETEKQDDKPKAEDESSVKGTQADRKVYDDFLAGKLKPGHKIRIETRGNEVIPVVKKVK